MFSLYRLFPIITVALHFKKLSHNLYHHITNSSKIQCASYIKKVIDEGVVAICFNDNIYYSGRVQKKDGQV
jgi:hypothetical protein